jgi:hypothetical protein
MSVIERQGSRLEHPFVDDDAFAVEVLHAHRSLPRYPHRDLSVRARAAPTKSADQRPTLVFGSGRRAGPQPGSFREIEFGVFQG